MTGLSKYRNCVRGVFFRCLSLLLLFFFVFFFALPQKRLPFLALFSLICTSRLSITVLNAMIKKIDAIAIFPTLRALQCNAKRFHIQNGAIKNHHHV